MAEPEELLADAARHATVFARDLWRRHRGPEHAPRQVGLTDVAARLDLLVNAVFGDRRRFRIAQAPPPASLLHVTFGRLRGPRRTEAVPGTDGHSVWLPSVLGLDDGALAVTCFRAMALQQAMRARRGSARVAETGRSPLVADIYLLLEAWSADEMLARDLPGVAPAIDTLRATALARRPPLEAFAPHRRPLEALVRELMESRCGAPRDARLVFAAPAASLAAAAQLSQQLAGDPAALRRFGSAPLLKDWWTGELLAPRGREAPEGVAADGEFAHDDAAPPRTSRLRRTPQVREAGDDEDDDDEGVLMVQLDDPHPHAEDPMGMRRPVDRDEAANTDELGDMVSDLPETRTVATPTPPKEVLLGDDPPDGQVKLDVAADDRERCVRYPEWDWRQQGYRLPGAGVRPSIAPPGPEQWVHDTLADYRTTLDGVRRRFEMLRARRQRLKRRHDGDEIDLDACVERRADVLAGGRADDALYEIMHPGRRDLAVMLLIDISGSTDAWVAQNRRVIDVEREALLLVSAALDGLGEPYAIEAFSGEGPDRVVTRTVKGFDEPYGFGVATRIAGLEPERFTRVGAALRHATALLAKQPASHRLLLLLSDGKPNDVDLYEGRYGVEDMRRAVAEANLQGLFTFCLTIDRQAPAYLPQVFGANQYALLTDPARLPLALVDWMRKLIVA